MRNHQEILLRDVAPHWDRDNGIEPVFASFNTERVEIKTDSYRQNCQNSSIKTVQQNYFLREISW
jgi:hypothetical protein